MPFNPKQVDISVGIFAHNEEENIERAITSVLNSNLHFVRLKSIVVISSGSFDSTNRVVRKLMKQDKRISLLEEAERHGKSAAINLFMKGNTARVLATLSGDLYLHRNALEEIGLPFLNPEVGMVGARPVPKARRDGMINEEIALLWDLHHRISLMRPKCGEFVAFLNVIRELPKESAVDEATIEVFLKLIGYKVVYAPKAFVYNKGPKTVTEFLTQRRRVQAGHTWVSEKYNYKVVTMQPSALIMVVMQMLVIKPQIFPVLVRLLGLEAMARILGYFDYYVLGKNPYVWKMVSR